jgi:hypothetical protein
VPRAAHRVVLLVVAVLACLQLAAPSAGAAPIETLYATVGVDDAYVISLTHADGSKVTALAPGDYDIVVNDASDIHNFHLTGPGINLSTPIVTMLQTTWHVTFALGSYHYQCDPHSSIMFGDFVVVPPQTLTVTKAGTADGSVTSTPAGIDCGTTCSASFLQGTQVTLTATPATGATFVGWGGGSCSGTGTCVVALNADTTVTATFSLPPPPNTFPLVVARTGSGSVTSSPAGIDCGATCSTTYAAGTTVTLTATADPGSSFLGWSGACTGPNPCVVTLSAATAVTASFVIGSPPAKATLTVVRRGAGRGAVRSSPAGIVCPSACSASFATGAVVTLTATPAAGSRLASWSGACKGSGRSCKVTLSLASTVTATFALVPLRVWGVTVRPLHSAGRWRLHVGLRVSGPASLHVSVERGGHVLAARRSRVAAGSRSALLLLPRTARAGRYTVRVVASGAGSAAHASRTVSLPPRR